MPEEIELFKPITYEELMNSHYDDTNSEVLVNIEVPKLNYSNRKEWLRDFLDYLNRNLIEVNYIESGSIIDIREIEDWWNKGSISKINREDYLLIYSSDSKFWELYI